MATIETPMLINGLLLTALTLSWIALSVAIFCVYRLRKQARITHKLYSQLESAVKMANSSSAGMGKKLLSLERELCSQQTDSSAPVASARNERAGDLPESQGSDLQDAAALFSAGLSAEEVARRCGISRAEASLMKLMHAQVQRSRAA